MNTGIVEGNKLIAEFMGWETDSYEKWCKPAFGDGFNPTESNYKSGARYSDDELLFNTSWDWLMPVVEKIYSFQKGKWHDKTRGIATDVWLSFQEKIDINETWKEVVKAITVLNDQPKTNK